MKKLICILLLLCCIGVMLTCVACTPGTGTNPGEGEGEGEGTGDNGQNTTPGMQMFDENGVFLYKLIRQDTNSSYIKQAFIDLRKAVDATFGIKVEFEDDWAEVREYEILVGMTNRPESAQVAEGLADYTYKIEVVGKKIVIVGKDDKATAAGVQYFMSTYLTDTTKITETLSATGAYEPHPLDIVLKDASTGKSNPRVVTTKYPTEDVVIADIIPTEDGYAVSNNGLGDSTAGIQKALNDCARNGGGTVYLPAGAYETLTVRGNTGDVAVAKEFSFTDIDVEVSTGTVKNYASATGDIRIKTSTGHILTENVTAASMSFSVTTGKVRVTSVTCTGDVSVTVDTGDAELSHVVCKNLYSVGDTGDLDLQDVVALEKFSFERDTGDIEFERCDAADIFIKTSTGDVEGSLLSGKLFNAKSNTGKEEVPPPTAGGKCEIVTSTGDIEIEVEP